MLINNEFVIEQYTGQSSLTLLTEPPGLDTDTKQKYNAFISNINTIYGSQNQNGSVPFFFKNANGLPSPNSTLKKLDPGQEYYFISKNSATFPYVIPAIGGSVSSPNECSELKPCCPTVRFENDTVSLSGESNIYAYITSMVSGLIPGQEYSYEYEPVVANWPSKINPVSGTFIAKSHTDTIDGVFSFCPKYNCSGYFPYEYDTNSHEDYAQSNIFSSLKINIYPIQGSSCTVMSDTIIVKCNKCIPANSNVPQVLINGGPKINLNAVCCENLVPLSVNITNAEAGKVYNFTIECWPDSVSCLPSSGSCAFGDGTGRVSTLVNTNGITNSVIKFTLNDNDINDSYVDFTSLNCNASC